MIIPLRQLPVLSLVVLALSAAACDGGARSRTPDEFAADSALAADLALANRDTLLVDSIGAYRPPAELEASGDSAPEPVETVSPDASPPPSPVVAAAPPAAPPPAPAPDPAPAPAKKAVAKLTGTRACNLSGTENQSECLRALLPAADARMNRIYRALITEMRLKEGVKGGAKDPASVQRLRVAQRSWLVYRDTECRRRGKGKEGARWARPRVRCLGEFANRRANELSDDFVRLTSR